MTAKSDGGNRTRPSSAIYRIIMVEFERQRLARGLSMAEVDDLAGTNDGHYAHMLYPDTPTGRQARWETVQEVADALFGRGFEIKITGPSACGQSQPCPDKGMSTNALKNRHWRHSGHYRALGAKGGTATMRGMSEKGRKRFARKGGKAFWAKLSPDERSAFASKASNIRWKRAREAQRKGEAHREANAQKGKVRYLQSPATADGR